MMLNMWLIVTVLGAAAVVASPSCPLGWTMYGHSTCMKMFGEYKNWSQSQYACRAHGAELVTLETKQKIYFVKGWMFDQGYVNASASHDNRIWVGGYEEEEGNWRWVGLWQGAIKYTDWNESEPNNNLGINERCLDLFRTSKWNDAYCIHNQRFICEMAA